MLSYEYIQFLNDKIIPYLPRPNVKVQDKINFRCPFCGDSKKSATKKRGWYYLKSASYYCFNCNTSMSGIKLLQALAGEEYDDIKSEYIRLFLKSGLNTSLSSNSVMPEDEEPNIFSFQNIINQKWKNDLSKDAIDYLNKRQVLNAPFLKEKLYSSYSTKNNEEFILIPWRINGIDAYYQVNDFKKYHSMKYIFPKNQKKLVYGLDNVDPTFPYIIAFEGVYDSLFVKNGVAVGTKAITEYQMKLIKQRWPKHQICCSFDNDKAGISSMIKLISKDNDIKYFRWFNQNTKEKDINDYVLAKNDISIFSNRKIIEKMIIDKFQMKMFLLLNGLWTEENRNNFKTKKKAFIKDNII